MNPVAIAIMAGIILAYSAAFLLALNTGTGWVIALLVILAVALFVRWR